MPAFGPVKRNVLIRCLNKHGFDGPYSGGKHPFMVKGNLTLTIPNRHQKDIGRELLAKILRQAGIPKEEWEKLYIGIKGLLGPQMLLYPIVRFISP